MYLALSSNVIWLLMSDNIFNYTILVVMEHTGKLVKIIIDKFFMKYWNSTRVYT